MDQEDQLEIQSNAVRSAISELINTSVFNLKEAFESQKKLRAKIAEFEKIARPVKEMQGIPQYEEGLEKLAEIKNRVELCLNRISSLERRFSDIEKAIEQ